MNDYYVYLHVKATDGTPFYVGKGRGRRAFSLHSRSNLWNNVVNKHGFNVIHVANNLTEQEAFTFEKVLVSKLGRRDKNTGCLTNQTDGGDGGSNPSDAMRAKLSYLASNRSEQALKNLSEAKKKQSAETRLKIAASNRGQKRSLETRMKMRKPKSLQARANMSEARKDKTVYHLENKSGDVFVGSQSEFKDRYGFSVSKLVTGARKTEKTWKIKDQ